MTKIFIFFCENPDAGRDNILRIQFLTPVQSRLSSGSLSDLDLQFLKFEVEIISEIASNHQSKKISYEAHKILISSYHQITSITISPNNQYNHINK